MESALDSHLLNDINFDIYTKSINGIYLDNSISIQLIYVINGSIRYYTNGKEIVAKEGELIIINQCENKFLYSEDIDNFCLILNINKSYIDSLGTSYSEYKFKNHIREENLSESIKNNMVLLYRLFQKKEDENILLNQVNIIYKNLIQNYLDNSKEILGYREKINYLIDLRNLFTVENLEHMTLKNIASELHLSISYVSKIFNELTGINFTDYIQQLKLYYSSIYLIRTDKILEDIAEIVNFESTKSLNRIYNKYLHLSPSEYRKKYKARESIYHHPNLDKILSEFSEESYQKHMEEAFKDIDLDYYIDVDNEQNILNKDILTIRNLKSLGTDYLKNITDIIEKIEIKEIILRFEYKDGLIYLKDINEEVSYNEIYKLLLVCLDNNINGIIALDMGDVNFANKKELDDKTKIFSDFLDILSISIGSNNMNKFSYLINIEDIWKYDENEDVLQIYKDYIIKQQRIIDEKLGTSKYNLGFNVGNVNKDIVHSLSKISKKLLSNKNVYIPSFIFMTYENKEIKFIQGFKENKEVEDYTKKVVKFLNAQNISDIPPVRNYLNGLFSHIDISDVDNNYKELFIISLIIKSIFNIENKYNYILDYVVKDTSKEEGKYYPSYVDKYGFYTPIYWYLYMLNDMKGIIVHNERGCIAVKNENDLYILIYGEFLVDYIYASKTGFYKLEKHKLSFDINIKGLHGRYKILTKTLSFEHGNPNYHINLNENGKYLSLKEKEYIQKLSIPNLRIKITEIEESYKETISYSPFNIILKKFVKI